ncbi:Protein kinase domain containing protein [Reticulomyxa filosa]|uniref:Protein kinase domain containing protein n=1 Tax=Reticulomyxa filosa TaxID=46433 RepID=X6NNF3_RETFI|nr:Protein kinase domain containing protein [Reticulomyxa filosa]|eukprot:ETO27453.1 Protein kinase domain containing protein [Reticulomyxa filosa]
MLPNNKPFGAAFMPPGKKAYMAPEVYNNSPFFGNKADVFSLGVIFFILFCGFPPFGKPCLTDPCFRNIYEKDISVLLEKWQLTHAISPQCADMLNKIFVPDVKRVNTQELLAHPFWAGVQPSDVNVHVTSEMEMKDELEHGRHVVMQPQNIADTDDGSNVGNVTSDESELKPMENNTGTCQDQNESKFENENRNEGTQKYNYSLDVQTVNLDFQSLNLDFQYSKRSDTVLQMESCEIRKRNFACDNEDDGDTAEENILDGIWNLEGQSDNE